MPGPKSSIRQEPSVVLKSGRNEIRRDEIRIRRELPVQIIFDLKSYLTCIPTKMSSFWSFFLFFFDLIFFRCELIIWSTVVWLMSKYFCLNFRFSSSLSAIPGTEKEIQFVSLNQQVRKKNRIWSSETSAFTFWTPVMTTVHCK